MCCLLLILRTCLFVPRSVASQLVREFAGLPACLFVRACLLDCLRACLFAGLLLGFVVLLGLFATVCCSCVRLLLVARCSLFAFWLTYLLFAASCSLFAAAVGRRRVFGWLQQAAAKDRIRRALRRMAAHVGPVNAARDHGGDLQGTGPARA